MTSSLCPGDLHGTRLSTKIKTELPYFSQRQAVKQGASQKALHMCRAEDAMQCFTFWSMGVVCLPYMYRLVIMCPLSSCHRIQNTEIKSRQSMQTHWITTCQLLTPVTEYSSLLRTQAGNIQWQGRLNSYFIPAPHTQATTRGPKISGQELHLLMEKPGEGGVCSPTHYPQKGSSALQRLHPAANVFWVSVHRCLLARSPPSSSILG